MGTVCRHYFHCMAYAEMGLSFHVNRSLEDGSGRNHKTEEVPCGRHQQTTEIQTQHSKE